jgi:tagatose 6-phosphate kinase
MTEEILVTGFSPTIQKTMTFIRSWEKNEVNRTDRSLMSASGKGANTARILAQMGEKVGLLTQTGGRLGSFFVEEMEKSGVRVYACSGDTEIRFCYTLLTEDPFTATELVEEGDPVSPETEVLIRRTFEEKLPRSSALVVAGSAAPGFSPSLYGDFIRAAGKKGIPVVVDRHGPLLREVAADGPLVVKINMYEFLLSYEIPLEAVQNVGEEYYGPVGEWGKKLFREYGHRFVLTNGGRDTLVIDGEKTERLTPVRNEPVNPIGCGDAVTGGVVSGLTAGLSLTESAARGMEWAALNLVQKAPGTVR